MAGRGGSPRNGTTIEGVASSGTFRCRGGRYVAIEANAEAVLVRFARAFGCVLSFDGVDQGVLPGVRRDDPVVDPRVAGAARLPLQPSEQGVGG